MFFGILGQTPVWAKPSRLPGQGTMVSPGPWWYQGQVWGQRDGNKKHRDRHQEDKKSFQDLQKCSKGPPIQPDLKSVIPLLEKSTRRLRRAKLAGCTLVWLSSCHASRR